MQIAYFDEVKYQSGAQPYYWLGALVASAEAIWRLESKVAEIASRCFGRSTLSRETELHAADIFHRKSNFKLWKDIDSRIAVLRDLATIISEEQELGRIYVRIEPRLRIADDHAEMAFMFLVEKLEDLLRSMKSPGMLIGDRENDQVSNEFAEALSRFRASGTPYQFGTELRCLIDTVHFTSSHHSRMLQLADAYVWLMQFWHTTDKSKHPNSVLVSHLSDNTNLSYANRYKHWPTEQSWTKTT